MYCHTKHANTMSEKVQVYWMLQQVMLTAC